MERFTGQPLRERPHLAVLFYDAVGDFVVVTPLLRGLREKYPGCAIDYFGGERSRQFEENCRLIDARFSVFGPGNALGRLTEFVARRVADAGPYDLVVNCDDHPALALIAAALAPRYVVGRCYDAELRSPLPEADDRVAALHAEAWASPTLLERFGDVLKSQFIGEILCRLAYVETDFARTEVPQEDPPLAVPDVLISTGGRRAAKLWPAGHWRELIDWCDERGLTVGLLGDTPVRQRQQYHSAETEDLLLAETALVDLRGQLSLPQVAGALRRARACVTIDNGIMHLAGAVGAPTLALFGASPWRLWAPATPHLRVVLGEEPCSLCEENRFRNDACLREEHVCLESLRPATVASLLADILR
ncbi:MAG: glycosyltransferase family 9 protein [Chloroflexota bacterium]